MKEVEYKYRSIPIRVKSSTVMTQPNENILIYSGIFFLKSSLSELTLSGDIFLNWMPSTRVAFQATTVIESGDCEILNKSFDKDPEYELFIDNSFFAKAHLSSANIPVGGGSTKIKGYILGRGLLGDENAGFDSFHFNIANFANFIGSPTKNSEKSEFNVSRTRLHLENDNYVIHIDKVDGFKSKQTALEDNGGYILLHFGVLKTKTGEFSLEAATDVFRSLDVFLSFINGTSTSVIFRTGYSVGEPLLYDYTVKSIDPFAVKFTWFPNHHTEKINDAWIGFCSLWNEKHKKDFIVLLIRWYNEIHRIFSRLDGALVLAQTCLELIYNYWIVEESCQIIGRDAELISAAGKIRLIVVNIELTTDVPERLSKLRKFVEKNQNIEDGPDAITYIRNALVHSNFKKRKALDQIPTLLRFEALELSIWYVELAILRILNYNHVYNNRCSDGILGLESTEFVPWKREPTTNFR